MIKLLVRRVRETSAVKLMYCVFPYVRHLPMLLSMGTFASSHVLVLPRRIHDNQIKPGPLEVLKDINNVIAYVVNTGRDYVVIALQ